jgi:hypothetical protein
MFTIYRNSGLLELTMMKGRKYLVGFLRIFGAEEWKAMKPENSHHSSIPLV